METAFIFPAFVPEYLGNEPELLSNYSEIFPKRLHEAAEIIDSGLADFDIVTNNFGTDELRSQLISYIFSCSLSDVLIQQGQIPKLGAGYSMGLYAALYSSGSITFESGLHIISQAYHQMKMAIGDGAYGMGSIIGLNHQEIKDLLHDPSLKIVNHNGRVSYLISGKKESLLHLLKDAQTEGALSATPLYVSLPYHHHMLRTAAESMERILCEQHGIQTPNYPLVSCIDGRILDQKADIIKEIVRNIDHPINWQHCFQHMLDRGHTRFIECGAGKSLYNICRFFPGNFKVYPLNRLHKLLQTKD